MDQKMRRQSIDRISQFYYFAALLKAAVLSSRIFYLESLNPLHLSSISESRKRFLVKITSSILTLSIPTEKVAAAETVGKEPSCNGLNCLGIWDGLLADCPHNNLFSPGAGCTSSQDDAPGIFAEPWDYSDSPINSSLDYSDQMKLLYPTIQRVSARRGDNCQILLEEDRYLRVLITDGRSDEKSIAEFYFTPNDTTIQFRIGSVVTNSIFRASSIRNMDRGEMIRKESRYLKIPVLRNRKRVLFFVESNLDQYGPGSASLGPPSEMKSGEINDYGRLSDNVDPKLKIDSLQQFPFSVGGRK
mmetsp:Transcript_21012/g.21401  ORF Transcript_21012/g.21401 Transcript_21012/m.21401 type:complete len:302 (+) Transcript_21012:103-1008(+)